MTEWRSTEVIVPEMYWTAASEDDEDLYAMMIRRCKRREGWEIAQYARPIKSWDTGRAKRLAGPFPSLDAAKVAWLMMFRC